jgi:hypothetical protein
MTEIAGIAIEVLERVAKECPEQRSQAIPLCERPHFIN